MNAHGLEIISRTGRFYGFCLSLPFMKPIMGKFYQIPQKVCGLFWSSWLSWPFLA